MKKARKIPQRKCVVCGELKDKNDLLRIVKNKEEGILIDESGKKNGRGAYICKSEACLKGARQTNKLNRVFKEKVSDELYEELEAYDVN
ncbi:RNase P modulator RnpM [uncultured Anaerococcus sp.]|uniref:RNase P modulator RnpM n=1 Tax=uncultured Anaerococcus sp. TaxID=293428 RepID=UPI002606980A|nr:YlxR family protein [uncultured Anaerococcus sp.]